MLSWRDIVLYGLSKEYPRDIISHIVHFLQRESISQRVEETRNYHIDRMPRIIKRSWQAGTGHYRYIQCDQTCDKEVYIFGDVLHELTEKWDIISPKTIEYTYTDCWRYDSFQHPNINFIYSFNRGRIFLRFMEEYQARLDVVDDYLIVHKLTDYKELK